MGHGEEAGGSPGDSVPGILNGSAPLVSAGGAFPFIWKKSLDTLTRKAHTQLMEQTSTYTFKTADEQEAYYRNRRVELLREIDQAHAAIRAAQNDICRAERDLEDAFFDLEITDEILSDYDAAREILGY